MPVVAVTGEFSWGPDVLVIPEYAFGVGVQNAELRLSDEHTEYGWFGFEQACQALRWDSNPTALWELDHRLRHGPLTGESPAALNYSTLSNPRPHKHLGSAEQ